MPKKKQVVHARFSITFFEGDRSLYEYLVERAEKNRRSLSDEIVSQLQTFWWLENRLITDHAKELTVVVDLLVSNLSEKPKLTDTPLFDGLE